MPLDLAFAETIKLIKAVGALRPQRMAEKVAIEQAIQALKTIFFFPNEVLYSLEGIEAGRDFDLAEASHLSELYGDMPEGLREMLDLIEPRRFAGNMRSELSDQIALSAIHLGKLSVRREIARFFGSYASSNEERHFAQDAGRIVAQITRLNSEIVKVEKQLKRRLKVGTR